MKTKPQEFGYKKECKHSIVYEPTLMTQQAAQQPGSEPLIATSIYVNRAVLPSPFPLAVWLVLTDERPA